MSRIKHIKVLLFLLTFFIGQSASTQIAFRNDKEQYDALKYVAMAHEMAIKGYTAQEPTYLISAALTLAEYPVKGTLPTDSIVFENAAQSPSMAGAKVIPYDPQLLLDDAAAMAGSDAVVLAMISRTREKITAMEGLPRGRKFSPLIQEFVLNATGQVKLWATFNAREIAEVYVTGNGATTIDLYLYDAQGKLIASDTKNIDDCYVTFIPGDLLQFRIEIKNNGSTDNRCLLMTN